MHFTEKGFPPVCIPKQPTMCGSHVVRLFIKYMISWVDFLPWIALLKRLVAMQPKYMDLEGKCNMDHWTVTSQSLCSSDLCLVSLPKFSTYLGRGSWTAPRAGRAEALLFSPWGRRKGLHYVFHLFFLFWFGYCRGDSCVKFFWWLICSSVVDQRFGWLHWVFSSCLDGAELSVRMPLILESSFLGEVLLHFSAVGLCVGFPKEKEGERLSNT